MKVLVTGASGLLGKKLLQRLSADHHALVVLSRPKSTSHSFPVECQKFPWEPADERPPLEAFQDVDAVIHLAGEPIGNRRWTNEQKLKIRNSRVIGTENLVQAIQHLQDNNSRLLISGSAIGYYGDQGDAVLTEDSPSGKDFLAQVCDDWETKGLALASNPLHRVVILRTGIVLSKDGGALEKLLPVFRLGLGGTIGSGRGWMSWIHIDDWVEMVCFLLSDPLSKGIFNAVSPQPVTNTDFTHALSAALKKPALFKIPRLALQLLYGEMSSFMVSSQRVEPKNALKQGFHFKHTDINDALKQICNSDSGC